MSSIERKFEKILNAEELTTVLEALRKVLTTEEEVHGADRQLFEPGELTKLKLFLRQGRDGAFIKVRMKKKVKKHAHDWTDGNLFEEDDKEDEEEFGDLEESDSGLPKYRALKKRMKVDFAEIRQALSADIMPGPEVIKRFVSDSALMVRYPGRGDEFYADYINAVEVFLQASATKNVFDSTKAFRAIEQIKQSCHAAHK